MDKIISEDRYDSMLGEVPPLYISTINGESFKGAFAVGEVSGHLKTPEGVKDGYMAFYQLGDLYYEVDGLVWFIQPSVAIRSISRDGLDEIISQVTPADIEKVSNEMKDTTALNEKEISRYGIPSLNKRICLFEIAREFKVIVYNTLTGDPIIEYPKTSSRTAAAKNYIEAIGEYGESKTISDGSFTRWIQENELNPEILNEYAMDNGVRIKDSNFAKGGKVSKTSSYPKKGHIFVRDEPEQDRPTEVFVNVDIFQTPGDYILGGFEKKDLDSIEVVGNQTVLTILKVSMLFRQRILCAVEKFYDEVEANLIKRTGTNDTIDQDFSDEISNLLETYLNIKPQPLITHEEIVDLIINSESAASWINDIGDRITIFSSAVMYNGVSIDKIDQSKVTIDQAEENTRNATLEQILEQLQGITERS